jgi:uncharacterized cupin superfamily protein
MRKANLSDLPAESWESPRGKFKSWGKSLNDAVGGDSRSMDLTKRWPFEVELAGIPPGKANCPFHSHAVQYEFYIVVAGTLTVRDKDGETEAKPGDFFMFGPGEAHQLINRTAEDVSYYCIADNPLGDTCHYPDSNKWTVRLPQPQVLKGEQAEYFEGEDGAGSWMQTKA